MFHAGVKKVQFALNGTLSTFLDHDGATVRDGCDLAGLVLVGIGMPAVWTAAAITFQVSKDGVTFRDVFNVDGTEFKLTTPLADQFIPLAPLDTYGWRYIRLRSGLKSATVAQGAARVVDLITRDLHGRG